MVIMLMLMSLVLNEYFQARSFELLRMIALLVVCHLDAHRRSVELYKTFVLGECVVTNARTAEMAKLTENSSH